MTESLGRDLDKGYVYPVKSHLFNADNNNNREHACRTHHRQINTLKYLFGLLLQMAQPLVSIGLMQSLQNV